MIVKIYSDGKNGRKYRTEHNANDISEINEQVIKLKSRYSSHTICDLDSLKNQKIDRTQSLVIIGHGNPSDIAGLKADKLAQQLNEYLKNSYKAGCEITEIILISCNTGQTYKGLNFAEALSKELSNNLDFPAHIMIKAPKGVVIVDAGNCYVIEDHKPFEEDVEFTKKIKEAKDIEDIIKISMKQKEFTNCYAVTKQFFDKTKFEIVDKEEHSFTKEDPILREGNKIITYNKHYNRLTSFFANHETKDTNSESEEEQKNKDFYKIK